MEQQNTNSVIIDLDDIQIEDEALSSAVDSIDKDLAYLQEEKQKADGIALEQMQIIEKNYKNQIIDNPYNNLNAKQMQCIDLYLRGTNKTQICKELNISRNALNSWFNNERFLEVLDNTKNDFDECNKLYFRNLVPKALERLADVLTKEETSDKDVISAAKLVLKGANLIEDVSTSVTKNQMQIIVGNVEQPKIREIESDVIDVDVKGQ